MSSLGQRLAVATKAVVGIFSENAAKEAFGMLSGIYPGQQGLPPTRGTKEILEAYSKMPWLRAVTARVATRCASTEWQLWVQRKSGERARRNRLAQRGKGESRRKLMRDMLDAGELERIEDHPMLDVLHQANSFQTGEEMRMVTQLHVDLVGEAFWLKERDALGTVSGVWPIPPNWILNTPTPTNPNFRVGFRAWRGMIPETEFVWFRDPDPANPYARGSGIARTLSDELETDEYAAKHTKAWFYNRARPDLLVYPKNQQTMREGDVKRLEQDWLSRNQGFWRAFKPYFLTREVGVHELAQDFRKQQIVQLRMFERDTVMQVYGMPPEMMGVLASSNRATITAADTIMGRYVVQPRLEFMRAILQERMAPEYDERLIVEFANPVQDDKDFVLEVMKALPGAFSVDENRVLANHPEMEKDAGRVHFVPSAVRVLDPEEGDGLATEPEPPAVPIAGAGGRPELEEDPEKAPWNLLGLR